MSLGFRRRLAGRVQRHPGCRPHAQGRTLSGRARWHREDVCIPGPLRAAAETGPHRDLGGVNRGRRALWRITARAGWGLGTDPARREERLPHGRIPCVPAGHAHMEVPEEMDIDREHAGESQSGDLHRLQTGCCESPTTGPCGPRSRFRTRFSLTGGSRGSANGYIRGQSSQGAPQSCSRVGPFYPLGMRAWRNSTTQCWP